VDGAGTAGPSYHKLTLNGGSSLGQLVRRTNPVALPAVAAPPAPAGTRNLSLNRWSDNPGNFATIRDLTLNGWVGAVEVPAGTYGTFTANGSNRFVLGVPGSTTPAVYNFRKLVLNGNSRLEIVGPVIITLHESMATSGSMGNAAHPEWLTLRVASSGGFTLNGHVSVHGQVVAPHGQVTINGGTQLVGSVIADRLVLNGPGKLLLTLPLP
jgi:rhamnogalacturonan endolyase